MDKLDLAAMRDGYEGPAYYHILCDVYADWKYREKPYRKPTSKIPKEQWLVLQEKYNYQCFYCGKSGSNLTKDHVIPVSKGGEDTMENIVPACMECNRRKGVKIYETTKPFNTENIPMG